MENKKFKSLSITALMINVLPLAALLPGALKIPLSDGVRRVWSWANIVFVLAGLLLSVLCVRTKESRSFVNIVSMAVSVFWMLLMAGIAALALFMNFLQ